MAEHLVAWFQSVDQATIAEINNVSDDILTRTGATRFLVPSDYSHIKWAAALGPNVTRAQVVTPSLGVKRISLEVVPRRRGSSAFTLTSPEIFKPAKSIPLIPSEEIAFQAAEDAAGASALYGLVALGLPELPAMPDGDVRTIRATGTTTLVANSWTTVTVTPDLTLEPGTYTLVGFVPISANAIAARAIITGQNFRPGMPALAGTEAAGVDFDPTLVNQLMGYSMGSFSHITIPAFQFLSSVADTAETVFLYAVRTGAPPAPAPG